MIELIAHHGYAVTALVLFLAAVGLPLPVAIALLAGGAAVHHGLRFAVLLPVAWCAAMLGDTLLYLGGRYTGWWLLAGMCRLSMNPEQCIRDTTSVRVAHMLQQENCRTRVIEGGMKAWMKAGGAMEMVPESDVQKLPRFE